jgi:hypothetical protein
VAGGFAGAWNGETAPRLISKHRFFDAFTTKEMLRKCGAQRPAIRFLWREKWGEILN